MTVKSSLLVAAAGAFLVLLTAAHDADARERRFEGQSARGGSGYTQVERGPGFRNRESSWTGAGGRTRSVDDQRSWGDGAYSHDRNTEYRDGTSRSASTDVTRTAPGEYSYDRSVTTRSGETREHSGSVVVTPNP